MTFVFACGGAATNNANNASSTRIPISVSNMTSNSANMTPAAISTPANSMANKTAVISNKSNTAAVDNAAPPSAKKPPKGSTFLCKDGQYSDAKTAQGACSGHGGIDKKL